ncbi:transporter substrate-binding domain-containing protein [Enterococcus italicus]|uniref:transporter substrate-binding domain-containing protein n=1 Tax=Enterococcus italicus TaxID=246144 RepID=UPI00207335FE|nr:transporter substrate-binding domain-containing protein [Enterococcus italicus]
MAAYEYEVNDERKEKFVYGDVGYVVWDTYIAYDPDKGETYNTFDDLKGKKVYVTTSTNQAAMAENYLKDNPDAFTLVYGEYSNEQIVQALTSGAVDATLAPKYQIDNYNKTFDVDLKIGDEPVHNSDAYLLFNKKTDTKLIDAVNTALKELKGDGTIKKLSEKYLDGDYVPKD